MTFTPVTPQQSACQTAYSDSVMDLNAACSLARHHLAELAPRRWSHVQGVASRAEFLSPYVDSGPLLVAACWLHDVGYAPDLGWTRFHPLDGARALHERGASDAMCGLVAFHSAAAYEAKVLGLLDELEAFTDQDGIVRDLLWYLDMTTSPDGDRVSFEHRMDEVRDRYPTDHYVIRALDVSMLARSSAVERAETWLSGHGLAGQV
ncbi:phosphohydrolase [Pseudonocardia sp. KRD291]|uniref:phosphohydrolase n=1 Tax=Pseudonocardia sp. KRD291 TaxID=2792007 RepID=UPI001C4A23E1|nr:phosphohydrolase [Pseudonocardia sp. KRD291]MBW0103660.1 phosphohydrolase [Pseudonocardia sp. KRD291]